jgi:hypothetical protein
MTAPLEKNGAPTANIEVPFRRAPPADLRTRRRVYGSSYVENLTSNTADKTPHSQGAARAQSHVHCVDACDEQSAIPRVSPPAP